MFSLLICIYFDYRGWGKIKYYKSRKTSVLPLLIMFFVLSEVTSDNSGSRIRQLPDASTG